MIHKEKIRYVGRDERMDSIGIPINPHAHAKQSTTSEFWTDLLTIFIGVDDIVGMFLSILFAIFFTLKWTFYLIGKLQKELIQDFVEAKEDAAELFGKQKADELMEEYFYEKKKRGDFTYNMGEVLIQSKAKTSLERAQKFRNEIKKIIEKRKSVY